MINKNKQDQTTYCVRIAYDGSNFFGWAKQPNLRTVESEINKMLTAIFKVAVSINGVSRTDVGVHANDQVFTFSLPFFLQEKKLLAILKQHFITDIKIKNVTVVAFDYDVRAKILYKQYRYYLNCWSHNPFQVNYEYQYHKKIVIKKLKQALKLFSGRNYFYCFSGLNQTEPKSPYRTVDFISVHRRRKQIVVVVTAKGFLRYQIRYMIAAALDYSQDKITLEQIKAYLTAEKKDKYPYPKAPAQGLYLEKVVLKN